jgi:hypothetical protein
VRRRFLCRLRGGNQDGEESEKAEEFHVVWCVEKADARKVIRKPPLIE